MDNRHWLHEDDCPNKGQDGIMIDCECDLECHDECCPECTQEEIMSHVLYSVHEYPKTLYRTWKEAAERILKIVQSWNYYGLPLIMDEESQTIKDTFGKEFTGLHITQHSLA